MDIYSVKTSDGEMIIRCMEKYRINKTFIQYTGNDFNEHQTKIGYAWPFREYGETSHYTMLVNGNTFSLNAMYPRFRVAYTLQAPINWRKVDVESFGDDFYNDMMPNDALSSNAVSKLIAYVDTAFKKGGMAAAFGTSYRDFLQEDLRRMC